LPAGQAFAQGCSEQVFATVTALLSFGSSGVGEGGLAVWRADDAPSRATGVRPQPVDSNGRVMPQAPASRVARLAKAGSIGKARDTTGKRLRHHAGGEYLFRASLAEAAKSPMAAVRATWRFWRSTENVAAGGEPLCCRGEVKQRAVVDPAFEVHHVLQRIPEVHPAPGVEFR